MPRATTVEAVAEDIDLATSTVSETLARAERRLARQYLWRHGEGSSDREPGR